MGRTKYRGCSAMPRISIRVSDDEYCRLKALATLFKRSMKEHILEQTLVFATTIDETGRLKFLGLDLGKKTEGDA